MLKVKKSVIDAMGISRERFNEIYDPIEMIEKKNFTQADMMNWISVKCETPRELLLAGYSVCVFFCSICHKRNVIDECTECDD